MNNFPNGTEFDEQELYYGALKALTNKVKRLSNAERLEIIMNDSFIQKLFLSLCSKKSQDIKKLDALNQLSEALALTQSQILEIVASGEKSYNDTNKYDD